MKLLLDENISFRLVKQLSSSFPGSVHVKDITPPLKSDFSIFEYAKENNYTIVTLDEDFIEIQGLRGFPPKIIWLRMGNSSTLSVLNKITSNFDSIMDLELNDQLAIIEIQ